MIVRAQPIARHTGSLPMHDDVGAQEEMGGFDVHGESTVYSVLGIYREHSFREHHYPPPRKPKVGTKWEIPLSHHPHINGLFGAAWPQAQSAAGGKIFRFQTVSSTILSTICNTFAGSGHGQGPLVSLLNVF